MLANRSTIIEGAPDAASRDTILGGRVVLWQPRSGYRSAIDPVLLAASVGADAGSRVLDFGCGVGAISLCLLARIPEFQITGLEIDPGLVALAERNVVENQATDRFRVIHGSVAAPSSALPAGTYDLVVTNPPFHASHSGSVSPVQRKRTANVEIETGLDNWILGAERALRPKGRIALIYRADRMVDLLVALGRRFGEIIVHPLWPRAGMPAKRIIVHARKSVLTPLCLTAGTALHTEDGQYASTVARVLIGHALKLF